MKRVKAKRKAEKKYLKAIAKQSCDNGYTVRKDLIFMKITNIVDYLASKAKASEDEKGYVTIQETVYRINDNYTYSYFTEYKEALEHYTNNLYTTICILESDVAVASGALQLDRIEVDYYDNVLSARDIYKCLTSQDITIYEFEYKK